MPRSINLTGKTGQTYDLEELQNKNTRTDSSEDLLVHIWYWNPNGIKVLENNKEKFEEHKNPNPPNEKLKIGQIWLSKLVSEDFKEV